MAVLVDMDTSQTRYKAIQIIPQEVMPSTGDSEDDYVPATACMGHGDYLMVGDRGLLTLQDYHGASIVAPQ